MFVKILGVGNMPRSATLLTLTLQNAQSRLSHEITSPKNCSEFFVPFAQVNASSSQGGVSKSRFWKYDFLQYSERYLRPVAHGEIASFRAGVQCTPKRLERKLFAHASGRASAERRNRPEENRSFAGNGKKQHPVRTEGIKASRHVHERCLVTPRICRQADKALSTW
ncbi:hypothetical protein [Hyphomicrobium sp. 2TAF46]|uniref:hypothetical protein n=1 Tax=Hyphomicrobium sp. 2TAF46 TaxID=3233019 RepID=UPI003F92A70E